MTSRLELTTNSIRRIFVSYYRDFIESDNSVVELETVFDEWLEAVIGEAVSDATLEME